MRKGRRADTATAEDQYEALNKYARDLTEVARAGKLDPVIRRDEEIRRTVQVLSRRTRNNPVLIGEPGVGKTAIVEGLDRKRIRLNSSHQCAARMPSSSSINIYRSSDEHTHTSPSQTI